MDSNGQKLKVRNTTGAYTPSGYRVEIEETADGFRRALKVKGAVEVEQSTTSFTAIWAKGQTSLEPIAGQTEPVLKVSGTSSGTSDYRAEIIDNSALSPQALKVQGDTHLWRGGNLVGRLQPNPDPSPELRGVFAINHGAGPDSPADRNVVIGQTASNPPGGNETFLSSRRVMVGGGGQAVTPSDEYPVSVNGPIQAHGTTPIDNIAIRTNGGIQAEAVQPIQGGNSVKLGTTQSTTQIDIGRIASQQGQPVGSQVNLRGDLNIIAGTNDPGDLNVAGQVAANGNLHANAMSFLQGNVDMVNNAHIGGNPSVDGSVTSNVTVGTPTVPRTTTLNGPLTANGDVTVGTTQQPRTATVKGQVDVSGGLTVGSALYVDAVKANNGDTVKYSSSIGLDGKLEVEGYSTFNKVTAHLAGINFNTAGTIPFNGIRFQNNRFEFYVASVLCFYIDSTGGHDA